MVSPIPLDLQAKISSWKQRAGAGTLTLEEMKEAIVWLRQGRQAAAVASVASKKRKTAVAPAADDLLSELEDL